MPLPARLCETMSHRCTRILRQPWNRLVSLSSHTVGLAMTISTSAEKNWSWSHAPPKEPWCLVNSRKHIWNGSELYLAPFASCPDFCIFEACWRGLLNRLEFMGEAVVGENQIACTLVLFRRFSFRTPMSMCRLGH